MTEQTMTMAHGISEYGIMIIICAVFLLLSSSLMIACFRWFKSVIENILGDYTDKLERLQEIAERNVAAAKGWTVYVGGVLQPPGNDETT